jgi:nuclear protein NHN1
MKRQAVIWGLMAILWLPAAANADIYRWKDANGVIHFSNQPPPAGAVILDQVEETPYDAEADRRRIEEERRLRLERQRLELEERKADIAAREREAQLRLEQANRRLEEARQIEQESPQSARDDDCDDGYYLRYGTCGPGYGYSYGKPGGSRNLYRGYYRDNNSLYYNKPPKPGHRPAKPALHPPGPKPAPQPEAPKSAAKPGKPPAGAVEPEIKEAVSPPGKPPAPR